VDVVKPNLRELGQLLGREVDREQAPEAAVGLLRSVRTVLLTLGAEGAYLVRGDPPVGRRCGLTDGELQNTVGCGDAFLAGWLRGEQVCAEPEEALCWAVAAGAASARSATTVGYALSDVRELIPRCEPLE
jgi:fructose-1-phosphate kinase PfkB-like protein